MAVGSMRTILLKGHGCHAPCIPGAQNQSVLGIEVTHIVLFCFFFLFWGQGLTLYFKLAWHFPCRLG